MKPPRGTILLLALAATGCAAWLAWENFGLRQKIAELDAALVAARRGSPRTTTALREATTTEGNAAAVPENADTVDATRPPANGSNFSAVRALWADPQFRSGSIQRAVTEFEERYGRFFGGLTDTPPAQIEAIKLLLATHSVDLAQAFVPGNDHESAEESAARMAQLTQLDRDHQEQLRAAMGAGPFAKFQDFQRTYAYRDTVGAIANGMRARGFAVQEDLQERILGAYADAVAHAADVAQREDAGLDPAHMTPEERRRLHHRQMERMQLSLTKKMSGILDGPGLASFIDAQLSRERSP